MRLWRSRRARDRLLVAALCVPTAWLLALHLRLPVDVENAALKDPTSRESAALARRVEQFGRDLTVMIALEAVPVGSGVLTALEETDLAGLRTEVAAMPGVRSVTVAPSTSPGQRLWVVALDAAGDDFAPLVEALERFVRARTPATVDAALAGLPVGEVAVAREVQREQARILPLVAAAFVVLLVACYRHAGVVLAVLAPAGMAIAWTGGLRALLGQELDPVSVLLQPVLLTVGVAAGVHWVEAYLDLRRAGLPADEAAERAVADLGRPALLASLTTVAGFLSLSFHPLPAVADFGVLSAVGVGLVYALSALSLPALLRCFAAGAAAATGTSRGRWSAALGPRAAVWISERAPAIRAGAVVVLLGGLLLAQRPEVDNDPQRILPAEHPFRAATERVAALAGGSDVLELLVPGGSPMGDPAQLGLLAAHVLGTPGVGGLAGPALRSDGGDRLLRFVLAPSGSSARERLFDGIEARAAALGVPEVRASGASVQVARDSGRLMRRAIGGTAASLAMLFLLLLAGFRSARLAWLGILPNALPCVLTFAALAAAGRPLSVATAMTSSVLLGLIVDDTIHLLHRYRVLVAEGRPARETLGSVLAHSGRAIVITSGVLGLGFAAGLRGSLATTTEFCALAAGTIAVALLCDLLLLPALLMSPRAATEAGRG